MIDPELNNKIQEIAVRSMPKNLEDLEVTPVASSDEDVYIPTISSESNPFDAVNSGGNPFAGLEQDNPFEGLKQSNPFAKLGQSNPFKGQTETEVSTSVLLDEPEALWEPPSLQDYMASQALSSEEEQQQADALELQMSPVLGPVGAKVNKILKQVDFTGAVENSFVRHAYEWVREATDDDYVSDLSIEGRKQAIDNITQQIKGMGPITMSQPNKIAKAEKLWEHKMGLMYKNHIDEIMLSADTPEFSEVVKSIYEDPEGFGVQVLQEIANKPELLFVPQFAATRGAAVAATAAKALNASKATTTVMKIAGTTSGAYVGGVSLGTLDRMATQSTKQGDVDVAKAFEQSQLDGVLGIALVGGQRALTKAVDNYSAKRTASIEASMKARKLSATEVNLKQALLEEDLEVSMRDPAKEIFMDNSGNVYQFDIRETVDTTRLLNDLDELRTMETRFEQADPKIQNMIKDEIAIKQSELTKAELSASDVSRIETDINALNQKIVPEGRLGIANKVLESSKRSVDETHNFVTVTDASGIEHTLKRVTKGNLKDSNIPGLGQVVYKSDNKIKASNTYKSMFQSLVINSIAPLERLKNVSPSAGKLIDLVDPNARQSGRAYLDTIQEATHHKQGEWSLRSADIAKDLSDNKGRIIPELESDLRMHMRGVKPSENPTVIDAATKYRQLIEDARAYSKEAGMQVDEAQDFLPRYYDQVALKGDQALADELVKRVGAVLKKDGTPKYDVEGRNGVKDSVRNIQQNIVKTGDEAVSMERGGSIRAIGNRSWKDIADSELDPFLRQDFIAGLDKYLMNNAARTELDRHFGYGGKNIDSLLAQIEAELPEGRILHEGVEGEGIRDMYKLLSGTYGKTLGMKPAVDTLLAAQTVTKLPLVTITSATEPLTMLFRLKEGGGLKAVATAFTPAKVRKLWKGRSMEQIEREAMEVGLIHEVALKERLDAMVGEGLEGWPATITNKFLKGVMLHQWTEHTRVIAYEMARNDISRMAKGLALQPHGKRSAARREQLAEAGIDADQAITWIKNGSKIDDPFYTKVKKGSARLANTMIANPNKINKGKWMSSNNPFARLTSQFKSFGSTFYNDVARNTYDDVTKRWNNGDRIGAVKQATSLFAAAGAMGYWAGYKNDYIYLREIEDDPDEMAIKIAKGAAQFMIPAGGVFVNPIMGDQSLSSQILGPTGGTMERTVRSVSSGSPKPMIGEVPIINQLSKE